MTSFLIESGRGPFDTSDKEMLDRGIINETHKTAGRY
jgi:hypothetical protein